MLWKYPNMICMIWCACNVLTVIKYLIAISKYHIFCYNANILVHAAWHHILWNHSMSPRVLIAGIIGLSRHTQADMIESAIICWEASWTSRRVWASQIFHSLCCTAIRDSCAFCNIIYCKEYIISNILGLVMVCLVDAWVCGITCSYSLTTRTHYHFDPSLW